MHIIITVLHKNTAAELYVSNSAALILFFWLNFSEYVTLSGTNSLTASEKHVMNAINAPSYPKSKITP
mgnify:CR=1 FL=1